MNDYFAGQLVLNVTLGHTADTVCSNEPNDIIWIEQWASKNDFNSQTDSCEQECKRETLINQLLSSQVSSVTHPSSQQGFTIVNILEGTKSDYKDSFTHVSFNVLLMFCLCLLNYV